MLRSQTEATCFSSHINNSHACGRSCLYISTAAAAVVINTPCSCNPINNTQQLQSIQPPNCPTCFHILAGSSMLMGNMPSKCKMGFLPSLSRSGAGQNHSNGGNPTKIGMVGQYEPLTSQVMQKDSGRDFSIMFRGGPLGAARQDIVKVGIITEICRQVEGLKQS